MYVLESVRIRSMSKVQGLLIGAVIHSTDLLVCSLFIVCVNIIVVDHHILTVHNNCLLDCCCGQACASTRGSDLCYSYTVNRLLLLQVQSMITSQATSGVCPVIRVN